MSEPNLIERLRSIEATSSGSAELLEEAAERIEGLEKLGQVNQAFYELTVIQRDGAWREVEALRSVIALLSDRVKG